MSHYILEEILYYVNTLYECNDFRCFDVNGMILVVVIVVVVVILVVVVVVAVVVAVS